MTQREAALTPSRVQYQVIDAFTDMPFEGNPAAVVRLGLAGDGTSPLEDSVLQGIAAEMNLSETAFPGEPDAEGIRPLRWFTPTTEVTLCGHATLAAAHALLEAGSETTLRFSSRSGPLTVLREADGRLRLDFPLDAPIEGPVPDGIRSALGLEDDEPARWAHGARCALLEVSSEARVASLTPDFRTLGGCPLPEGVMGISVTAAAEAPTHFVSRFFGPWVGVDEDPVTGMAHCLLAPWWATRLGTNVLEARQWAGVGPRTRGGHLEVRVVSGARVHLVGRAITVAEGTLRLRP